MSIWSVDIVVQQNWMLYFSIALFTYWWFSWRGAKSKCVHLLCFSFVMFVCSMFSFFGFYFITDFVWPCEEMWFGYHRLFLRLMLKNRDICVNIKYLYRLYVTFHVHKKNITVFLVFTVDFIEVYCEILLKSVQVGHVTLSDCKRIKRLSALTFI